MLSLNWNIKLAIIWALCFSFTQSFSQTADSDSLFSRARAAAFKAKDFNLAKELSLEALSKSPENHDIRIFLGRVYSWTQQADSARKQFSYVLQKEPHHSDASFAFANLEYWNGNEDRALEIINDALNYYPQSEDLLMLQAKVYNRRRDYEDANTSLAKILAINSGNSEARALAASIRENSSKHKVSVNYNYVSFDRQFNDPWHLSSAEYSRNTKIGSVSGRINYARRFNRGGIQAEADAYPKLTDKAYAYITTGFSSKEGIFPRLKVGMSLFTMLPANFEAEIGFRQLNFESATQIYVASIGKYLGRFWWNFRTNITANGTPAQSYFISSRYYLGGSDDYVSLGIGTGVSADDASRNLLLALNEDKLNTYNTTFTFRKSIAGLNNVILNAGWIRQQLQAGVTGNQYEIGLGYQRRF